MPDEKLTDEERLELLEEFIDKKLAQQGKFRVNKVFIILVDGVQQRINGKTSWSTKSAASQALGRQIRTRFGTNAKFLNDRYYDYNARKYVTNENTWLLKDFLNAFKQWKAKHVTIIEDKEIQKLDEILEAQKKAAELAELRRKKREENRAARAIAKAKREAKKAREAEEIRKKGRWYKLLED